MPSLPNEVRSGSERLAKSIVSLVFVLLLGLRPSFALDPNKMLTQYAHRIWGQEEGLLQPTIYSILQTRDGFLWLGTQDSLVRFDGMHFREYDDAAFRHSLIRSLAQDKQGDLWVGSLGAGVAKITPAGVVTQIGPKQGLPSDSAFCIAPDDKGQVWVCTNQGLAILNGGRVRVLTTADGLPTNQIRSTCESPNGERWAAGLNFGLVHWNGSKFERFSADDSAGATGLNQGVTALVCASDGAIWAGSDAGLVEIRDGAVRSLTSRDGLPDDAVSALAEGPDGSIWVGTNDGISRYRNGEWSVYRTRDGLSHSNVLSLYVDLEGSLWAGTKDGLDQFTDGDVTPYTTNQGMPSNEAGPVIEDKAQRLWIGTLGRGLDSFDGRHFRGLTTKEGLADNTILSLEVDTGGDLWVGTKRGLNRLHDGRVIATYTQKNGLPGAEINALFADVEGVLWVGTNKGLARFNGGRFVDVDPRPKSNAASGATDWRDPVTALSGGRTVRLFASTTAQGFYLFRNNEWSSYSPDIMRAVDCYFLDHDHHSAWMGTIGAGLVRWKNGVFSHVHMRDGLYDNRIYSIVRDDRGNFWMASSKGIFRVSQQELDNFADGKVSSITSMPFTTGQLRFECQSGVQPAAYRTHDGRLWFSTTNGVVVVDPNHLQSNRTPPAVDFTAVLIDGRRVDPHQEIRLQPMERNLEIRYAGLSFVSPEKVAFRYILDGYDKTWTEAGTRREAFFTNLPPGEFEFKVMARNAAGVWSKSPAVLRFSITPRLYQRHWFFPAVAVVLGLIMFAAYRLRIRQLRKRFDVVLAERGRIARELHDTLLQGLAGITMQLQALWARLPASKEKQFLGEIIEDAGRCSAEARQSVWGLRAVGTASALHLSEKLARISRQAALDKPIRLILQLEPVKLDLSPEVEYHLLRIAQEVISNVLAHARAQSLEISLRVENEELHLVFEDDGVGFAQDEQQPFGHFGLIGMRERADEIGAKLIVSSAPGRGTSVSITLPFAESEAMPGNVDTSLEHQVK